LLEEMKRNHVIFMKAISEDLKDLIRKCLYSDDKKRLTIKDINNHAFTSRIIN